MKVNKRYFIISFVYTREFVSPLGMSSFDKQYGEISIITGNGLFVNRKTLVEDIAKSLKVDFDNIVIINIMEVSKEDFEIYYANNVENIAGKESEDAKS